MSALAPDLRRELDKAVVEARAIAEGAARAALERLGVIIGQAPAGETDERQRLRVQLQAKKRAEGHEKLIEEIAYGQWHRMLFARFLAENNLLLHPEGAPVTLADVKDLAVEEGERDPWLLAARYAAAMLPGIFGTDDPANRVNLAPEDRSRLEAVLERLPVAVFTSDDGLGWVYQFWQSQRKDEVNKRGDKIGGADLPAVTQLFTEHYMVRFLLENSLGAWWAGRHPNSPLLKEWEYLRFRDDGTPAAGTFEGWPKTAAEITVMDPCCGSGHFLVAAADMLRKMRAEEEGLTAKQAAVAVIRDNIFGLELDARCLQLAAFNLALDAWKAGGYQPLPIPNLACTGIAIKGQRADWQRLAGNDENMRAALDRLYDLFQDAPELGSLIDPRSAAATGTVWQVDVDQLLSNLDTALQRERSEDPAAAVFGEAAAGTAKAAQLLAGRYWLVATNPPFLGDEDMSVVLRSALQDMHQLASDELGFAICARSTGLAQFGGYLAVILPQAWLGQPSFEPLRNEWLSRYAFRLVARLGPRAFRAISGEVVSVALNVAKTGRTTESMSLLDAAMARTPEDKESVLRGAKAYEFQVDPRRRREPIRFGSSQAFPPLSVFARGYQGIKTGDDGHLRRKVWEFDWVPSGWRLFQSTTDVDRLVGGLNSVVDYRRPKAIARLQGQAGWGRSGVAVSLMGRIRVALYFGAAYDSNVAAIVPEDQALVPAIWAYANDPSYEAELRSLEAGIKVNSATVVKVPFDLERWQKVAAEQYPNGLPEPHSDDPTQWLFKGNIVSSEAPLQVAVARLLGYRWPDQEPDELDELVDADGLVPLSSVSGEAPAADRLRDLLARAYGDDWSPQLLERLLAEAGSPGATLETWLRDDFVAQHTKLFHQRPFIWHIWDGRKDGFSVLCHYHRLDRAKLEKLTYTLLNDWIERQRAASDEPGAEARLNAALTLQDKLKLIIEGEPPYDIYVRWKSLAEQPLGWQPDLDDGVRLNIRPFVTANVLRAKVNVKWDKDRGKNRDGSERMNDVNLTIAQKRAARAAEGS